VSLGIQFTKKAAPVSFMADTRPDWLDAHDKCIGIAIYAHLEYFQDVATRFTLLPKFVSRAAEEHDFTRPHSFGECFQVHETQHQDVAGAQILNDGRNQPAGFLKIEFHFPYLPFVAVENKKPAGAWCASGLKSGLFSESLSTPQRARRVAVMMMRPSFECSVHCEL
jgi:hypothetical protein